MFSTVGDTIMQVGDILSTVRVFSAVGISIQINRDHNTSSKYSE